MNQRFQILKKSSVTWSQKSIIKGLTHLLLLEPFYTIETNFMYYFAHDCKQLVQSIDKKKISILTCLSLTNYLISSFGSVLPKLKTAFYRSHLRHCVVIRHNQLKVSTRIDDRPLPPSSDSSTGLLSASPILLSNSILTLVKSQARALEQALHCSAAATAVKIKRVEKRGWFSPQILKVFTFVKEKSQIYLLITILQLEYMNNKKNFRK